jgi:hypothetical protein
MDRLEPKCKISITDTEDPNLVKPYRDRELPSAASRLIDSELDSDVISSTETALPRWATPYTENALPAQQKLLNEQALPSIIVSRMLSRDPSFTQP